MDAKEALERLYPAMQDAHVQRSKFYAPRGPVKTEADADNDLDLEALSVLRAVVEERDGLRAQLELIHPEAGHLAHAEAYTKLESENYALRAEVVTLKQEISGNDSAHRLLLAEVERLKKGNEMVNQLLGEMTGKRDALKARLAEARPLLDWAARYIDAVHDKQGGIAKEYEDEAHDWFEKYHALAYSASHEAKGKEKP